VDAPAAPVAAAGAGLAPELGVDAGAVDDAAAVAPALPPVVVAAAPEAPGVAAPDAFAPLSSFAGVALDAGAAGSAEAAGAEVFVFVPLVP
jgi:hypothetical protein